MLFRSHSIGSLSQNNQARKRNKKHQSHKGKIDVLFADDMIPYIENPKDATRKLLELSNEFRLISKKTSQDQESHAKDLL